MNELFELGRNVQESDSTRSPYLYLAYNYHLDNYRLITNGELAVRGKHLELPKFVRNFILSNDEVLMIANKIGGKVVSMTFRTLTQKQFIDWGNSRGLFYGFGDLSKDFKYGDLLLIVEGQKDRDVMKIMYPNTLACLTSTLSEGQLQVIRYLTNNVMLMFDNDVAGNTGSKRAEYRLKKSFKVSILKQYPGYKDAGDLINLLMNSKGEEFKQIESYYRQMIEISR